MKYKISATQPLVLSILSLCLCVSMLLGVTYAWFVDNVTSANNIVKSGSLDIDIEYARGENGSLSEWKTVSGTSDIFSQNTSWEPGRTEVIYFKVVNYGTLALKYKLTISILSETIGYNKDGGEICLSDNLVFKVVEMNDTLTVFSDRQAAITAAESSQGIKDYGGTAHELHSGEKDYLALIVHMPETLDNSFNYHGTTAPSIALGINLLAIQMAFESDGFGTDYDAGCDFPKSYGLLIDKSTDLVIDFDDFDQWSYKNLDSLIHVTDGAVVNIYGKINERVYNGGYIGTPTISADKNSVVNIYGGTYYSRATSVITAVDGAKFNIYQGIFGSDAYSGDGEQTDQLLSCAPGCEINIFGGTFVNFDPSKARDDTITVADSYTAIDTLRANGEIWYTVAKDDYEEYRPIFGADDMLIALQNGADEILFAHDIEMVPNTDTFFRGTTSETMKINGYGSTITAEGIGTDGLQDYGYISFIPANKGNAEIRDIKVVGSGYVEVGDYKEPVGTYLIENLIIENLSATYHVVNEFSIVFHPVVPAFGNYGTATLKNCIMTGTTTKHTAYKPYDAGLPNGSHTFIEGGKYGSIYIWHQAHVTITDAEVDIIDSCAITAGSLGKLTVGEGAKVGTITLTPGTFKPSILIQVGAKVDKIIYDGNNPKNIVIEEGAVVLEILYKGTTYTLEAWRAYIKTLG
jgi:hypothetical protein